MNNSDILISIIVPLYNAGQYIEECLYSILSQSIENIEVIVVDDGSIDDSIEKVKKFCNKDSRVQLVCLEKNSGPGAARNVGIRLSRGKYCLFMDSDDKFSDDSCVEYIYNKVNAGKFLVGCCDKIDFDDKKQRYIPDSSIRCGEYICSAKDVNSVFWYTTYIYNRKFLIENEIFFPEIRVFEDPVFLAKILRAVDFIYYSDKILYVYRLSHKKTITSMDKVNVILSAQEDIRSILSDDYNIWKQQYISILNVISDGIIDKLLTKNGRHCLWRIKKIIQSFPNRYHFKSNICIIVFLSTMIRSYRLVATLIPDYLKGVLRKIMRKMLL